MYIINDDPIVHCIEQTGLPPWMQGDDWEDERDDELEAAREKASELLYSLEDDERITDAEWNRLSALYDDACTIGDYYDCIDEFQAVKSALA